MMPPTKTPLAAPPLAPKHSLGARPTVHELQELAREAARPRRRRRRSLSRAARLHLIDMLSRWGGSGLALIAGVAIFIAVSAGNSYPLAAAVWLVLVLAALYITRRLRREFRVGERSAAKPFRWRANYTSSLAVLSAAFGAGAVIAVPANAPADFAFESFALILAASLGAGVLHAGHERTAAAALVPAAAFVVVAAYRTGGAISGLAAFGAAAAGGAALFFFSKFLRERAARRFPRTGLIRQEVEFMEPEIGPAIAGESTKAHA